MALTKSRPDFICIGPEKTGTTWLYSALAKHPNAYLPPVKELRYFNEGNLVPKHALWRVFFSRNWHYRILRRSIGRGVLLGDAPLWRLRHAFGSRSDVWYRSLFTDAGERVCGDISPLYYHLQEDVIARMARGWPETRIIMFVRDPVERAWSKARMNLIKHRGLSAADVGEDEFACVLNEIRNCWDSYLETKARWERHFEKVYFGSYDMLCDSPSSFYAELLGFLGLPAYGSGQGAHAVVKPGISKSIPEPILQQLIGHYREEILDLVRAHYEPAQRWALRYGLVSSDLSAIAVRE